MSEIEAIVSEDPVMAAHLMRIANSALVASRRESRSVASAILQLGFERTKLHIWGLSAKTLFATPMLSRVWNHSILTAQIVRHLAEASNAVSPDEACLTGLVHDIGQLVLTGLGRAYQSGFAQLRAQGLQPVDVEQQLCGSSHAEIGADLLASWSFPADIVEAVRQHHTPAQSDLPLTSLLYIAESWVEAEENLTDLAEHRRALRRLKIERSDLLRIAKRCAPDLDLLRLVA